jgi:hypothetical protein
VFGPAQPHALVLAIKLKLGQASIDFLIIMMTGRHDGATA